ncbi:hypothetical protein [Paraliomyxa miuraensis]|uniref:hypothetical protein n=1 Tax=Paraliomyxa miuraensis TaxID=376150 RepID=UPI00224F7CAF|nr:hypothetical protein [Paraliomyxa miuraensis]MCX4243932.1 hypothetical protein [Paraliomyxa miuraensis]
MNGVRRALGGLLMLTGLACGSQVTRLSTSGDDQSTTTSDVTSTTMATTVVGTSTTTTAGPGTTAVDTTAGSSTGSNFIDPPPGCDTEGGGTLVECDVWAQDCCAGDKCMPWANDGGMAWNATRCSPIAPEPHVPGEPCSVEGSAASGLDDCDATSMCWAVDPDTLMGECVPLCQGSEEEPVCRPGTDCIISNDGVLILCLERCDPLAPDCGEGQHCAWVEDAPQCVPGSGVPKVGPGDPCEAPYACGESLHCVPAAAFPGCAAAGCCSPYCDVTDPGGDGLCMALDPGLSCQSVFEPGAAPAGLEHLGACFG